MFPTFLCVSCLICDFKSYFPMLRINSELSFRSAIFQVLSPHSILISVVLPHLISQFAFCCMFRTCLLRSNVGAGLRICSHCISSNGCDIFLEYVKKNLPRSMFSSLITRKYSFFGRRQVALKIVSPEVLNGVLRFCFDCGMS